MTTTREVIEGYRLSPHQEHVWALGRGDDTDDGATPYRAWAELDLRGEVDAEALWRALERVVGRHQVLRLRLRRAPGFRAPLQEFGEVRVETAVHDLAGEGDAGVERFVAELLRRAAGRVGGAADGGDGPVVVADLVSRSADRHRLLLTLPALVADRATLGNLVAELAAGLAGEPGPSEDEVLQYAVFADWVHELQEAEEAEPGRRFWRRSLGPRTPEIPGETAESGEGFAPAAVAVPLNDGARSALAATTDAERHLFSAWAAFLGRLTGERRLTVGHAFDGRTDEDLERSLGLFARYLPVAVEVDPAATVADLAAGLEESLAEAGEWQEVFSWQLADGGDDDYLPLVFDTVGGGAGAEPAASSADGLELAWRRGDAVVDRYHLRLASRPAAGEGGAARLELGYDAGRFTAATAQRTAERFATFLTAVLAEPGTAVRDLPLLGDDEGRELFEELAVGRRGLSAPWPDGEVCLHQLFAAGLAADPAAVALVDDAAVDDAVVDDGGGDELTYAEVEARSNRLAHLLRRRGTGRGDVVAVCLERSPQMVVALLAVLKAGAAYLPVDPEYPGERVSFLLADSAAGRVVTTGALARALPETAESGAEVLALDELGDELAALPASPPDAEVGPGDLAYVIYTSGSTGRPKGVMIPHRAIANRLLWTAGAHPMTVDDRLLQKTTFSFDASVWEIFVPLLAGARLILARPGGHKDPAYLVSALRRHGITVLQGVPSLLRALVERPELAECRSLRRVFSGGEALPTALVRRLDEMLDAELVNLYGPTEVSIDATSWPCDPRDESSIAPIGGPIANTRTYVVGSGGRALPLGMAGELRVGGRGLAWGYLGRPALTAERFVPDPWSEEPGGRLYRTGDLVRWRESRVLEFLGRLDHQVKVRGFRIELGEVEAALRRHSGVADAAVSVTADARLAAYVVPRAAAAGEDLYRLPNGLHVAHLNRGETDWLYTEIFQEDAYSRHHVALGEAPVVFDVGANIGLFHLFVHQRFPDARLHCFEPMPATFDKLRANAALHDTGARLHPFALSDRAGRAEFTFYPKVSASSGRYADAEEDERVTRAFLENQDPALAAYQDELMEGRFEAQQVDVELRTLSQVMAAEGVERIDLLKLDVEKSELDVLRGIDDADWPKIRQVVMEAHDRHGALDEIRDLLAGRGFEVAVEEADLLRGSGLYNVYARRADDPVDGTPLDLAPVRAADGAAGEVTPAALREHLVETLPDYMMPSFFVLLDALPRTPNGKVDRGALPDPLEATRAGRVELRGPLEEMLADLWCELLGRDAVSREEDFFDLGGHSLLATRAVTRIRETFGVELPLTGIFEASTLSALAQRLEARLGGEGGGARPPLGKAPRDRALPLSYAQRRLWYLDRLRPGEATFNIPVALRLTGRLDRDALVRALDTVVSRHEVLRTTFHQADGEPVQVVHPHRGVEVPLLDLSDMPEAEREARVRELASEQADTRFDLEAGPPLRAALVRLDRDEHVALFTLHHIVSDGWSMEVLTREVAALYAAYLEHRPDPLPPLEAQYADFAHWQRDWLSGDTLDEQLAYWRGRLADAPPRVDLPTDRPRPAEPSHDGARHRFRLPAELTGGLRELARQRRSTLFMTLLAGYQALLYRYSGADSVSVGAPVANRQHAAVEDLVGCFVNTLVMRTATGDNPTFGELLERVKATVLGAHAHQDVPFELIVEDLKPEREPGSIPFVNVWFVLQNRVEDTFELPHLVLSPQPLDRAVAQFDLVLAMSEGEDGVDGVLTYATELFDAATAEEMGRHLAALLAAAAEDPDSRLLDLSLDPSETPAATPPVASAVTAADADDFDF